MQGRVQCDVETWSRCIDDRRPAGFGKKIVSAVGKRRVVKERGFDSRIVKITSLCRQVLAQVLDAILKLLSDKAKEHKRQHHVTLFEERTRIARLPKDIPTLEQNRIQVQFLFRCLSFLSCCRHYYFS